MILIIEKKAWQPRLVGKKAAFTERSTWNEWGAAILFCPGIRCSERLKEPRRSCKEDGQS